MYTKVRALGEGPHRPSRGCLILSEPGGGSCTSVELKGALAFPEPDPKQDFTFTRRGKN